MGLLKADVDRLKQLEDQFDVFTHMTPSYGMPGVVSLSKGSIP